VTNAHTHYTVAMTLKKCSVYNKKGLETNTHIKNTKINFVIQVCLSTDTQKYKIYINQTDTNGKIVLNTGSELVF